MPHELSEAQRRALRISCRKGGATIAARFRKLGKHDVGPDAARAVAGRGLATIRGDHLEATDAGRHVLREPEMAPPRLLSAQGAMKFKRAETSKPGGLPRWEIDDSETTDEHGYTVRAEHAILDAGEAVDEETQRRITERKMLTAEQRMAIQHAQAAAALEDAIAKLEPLAAADKRYADRRRILRKQLAGLEKLQSAA